MNVNTSGKSLFIEPAIALVASGVASLAKTVHNSFVKNGFMYQAVEISLSRYPSTKDHRSSIGLVGFPIWRKRTGNYFTLGDWYQSNDRPINRLLSADPESQELIYDEACRVSNSFECLEKSLLEIDPRIRIGLTATTDGQKSAMRDISINGAVCTMGISPDQASMISAQCLARILDVMKKSPGADTSIAKMRLARSFQRGWDKSLKDDALLLQAITKPVVYAPSMKTAKQIAAIAIDGIIASGIEVSDASKSHPFKPIK